MAELKKAFLQGKMNKDADERIVAEGQYRDALNIDIVHSEGGDAGSVRNMKGNTKLGDLGNTAGVVATNARTIGATVSEADNLIYYLVAADTFDGIYEYSELTGTITRVMQSNKATPSTDSKFAFDQDYYVTGINFLDGFLYWTDNLNDPRRVNISRAKSYNIDDSRIDLDLKVIKPAPLDAPMIDMEEETGQENNLEEKFLQFAIRYKYVDDQYSSFSPFSGVAFVPGDYFLDYGAGENKSMLNTKNKVKVSFTTGNEFVEEIELLVRDTKDLNISVVESFNKKDLDIIDDDIHEFSFTNNKIYRVLPPDQLTRLFDNVPLKAKAQEVIDRRIIYGNYVQFYDVKDSDGVDVKIDLDLDFVSKYWVPNGNPINTFRSDRDYEVGIQYGDDEGRFTTTLASENNTTYIPPQYSVNGNSLVVNINNEAPDFATNYRVVIKQNKKEFYNIFPILYYASGMYRYFLINDFDLDKVRVGEYVIFKADLDGATQDNKKYKVLELEQKAGNFLNLNGTTEIPGLYFKIKVDDSSEFNPAAVFEYDSGTVYGSNWFNSWGSQYSYYAFMPISDRISITESPIHYGSGNPNVVDVVSSNFFGGDSDKRLTVEITGFELFKYTFDVGAGSGWIYNVSMTPGLPIAIPDPVTGVVLMYIQWSTQSFYEIGDYWKINGRCDNHFGANIFGGIGIPGYPAWDYEGQNNYGDWGGAAVLLGATPGWIIPTEERTIYAGAVITIDIISDSQNPTQQYGPQQFDPSPRDYKNIEEWFIETGAYLGFKFLTPSGDVGSQAVTFRRVDGVQGASANVGGTIGLLSIDGGVQSQIASNHPMAMIIQGYGYPGLIDEGEDDSSANILSVSINIQQTDNLSICETEPRDSELDIYHETTRTYPITNGLHKVTWSYLDYTFPGWETIDGTQYTNIGQLNPAGDPEDTDGIEPHYFQVGDRIQVSSGSPVGNLTYSVLHVPNKYNVVIDLPAPPSGMPTPGKAGFFHDDISERDQTASLPATILLNPVHKFDIFNVDGTLKASLVSDTTPGNTNGVYNAYTFGNGLETDRIRDNFNSTTLEYSPRTSSVIEDYQQERKTASLTYSGVYRADTSVNRLNEFNLSNRNYKNLDLEFGSVQKLYARDTDVLVFQADKLSRILYGKNILSDAVGGGSVTSVPEVLGTQVAYVGEWGISFNPESFAQWANNLYWTDSRRGAVLMMGTEGITPISNMGMKDYFRDLLSTNPNTQKLGVFDPYKRQYIIASNSNTSKPCSLSLSKDGLDYPASGQDGIETPLTKPDFFVFSNTSWSVSIVYSAGSGWVTGYPTSGFGDQAIYLGVADNNTGSNRTATITFTYCGGLTATFVVTQGAGQDGTVVTWVIPPIKPIITKLP